MTVLFECGYVDERYFGFGVPRGGESRPLYPLGDNQLAALVREAGGEADVLTAGRERVDVPAEELHKVRMRVPLLPDHVGDALVSGFMMTHNVKVDTTTPDQPNWFFKGLGDTLRLPGEPLSVPGGAVAVCEEAEIVLVYVGDEDTEIPRSRRGRGSRRLLQDRCQRGQHDQPRGLRGRPARPRIDRRAAAAADRRGRAGRAHLSAPRSLAHAVAAVPRGRRWGRDGHALHGVGGRRGGARLHRGDPAGDVRGHGVAPACLE